MGRVAPPMARCTGPCVRHLLAGGEIAHAQAQADAGEIGAAPRREGPSIDAAIDLHRRTEGTLAGPRHFAVCLPWVDTDETA